MRLGLFCSLRDGSLTTNRTCRLASLDALKVKSIVTKNLDDLPRLVAFCESNDIGMFRLGNSLVPFASHSRFDPAWWEALLPLFETARQRIKGSNVRLTIHPGQFIQIGSPKESVVASSLRELEYCTKVLDLLGSDTQSVMTLHVGGAHGDHEATMQRFIATFHDNPWLGKYLALENDEFHFNALQTLETAKACGIGMIFDWFHHQINPSEVLWRDIEASWGSKRPKLHLSSQAPNGRTGQHADFIDPQNFHALKLFLGDAAARVDLMVEAKAKEDAVTVLQKALTA